MKNSLPVISQDALRDAVMELGVPDCTVQRLGAGLTLGKVIQALNPRLVGMATVMEVIETTRKELAEIERLSGQLEPEQEAEMVKLRYNLLRVRLEAGKALLASQPHDARPSNADEEEEERRRQRRQSMTRPGEIVGLNGGN